jgi:glycogen debranching enzyme
MTGWPHPEPSPLTFADESAELGQVQVRSHLLAGSMFCLAGPDGDLAMASAHGWFVEDTRFLTGCSLHVDGRSPDHLCTVPGALAKTTVLARARLRPPARTRLLVLRTRTLEPGYREMIELRNYTAAPVACTVGFALAADFASIFQVKEDRPAPARQAPLRPHPEGFAITQPGGAHQTVVRTSRPATLVDGRLDVDAVVPAGGRWRLDLEAMAHRDGVPVIPRRDATPSEAPTAWIRRAPVLHTTDRALLDVYERSVRDLAALRLFDDRFGDRPVLAAGAPWFMTLFGRDSLLAALMAMPVDPTLARTTLEVLASFQGRHHDLLTEEQPGRILHEARFGRSSHLGPHGGDLYYGSADSTPLFVMVAGELARWNGDREELAPLMEPVDRALRWIDEWGDRDGDGYVEYQRTSNRGLVNQGWKDSTDAISLADGRLADAPLALIDVQAYVYGAFRARADLARLFDDRRTAEHWGNRARELRDRFNRDFWMDRPGRYALALDGRKRHVDALSSNVGHALWTGIVADERVPQVAEELTSPALWTGWGIRTLASTMARYDPLSYHNGSVWPHDTTIAGAGLVRSGRVREGRRLLDAVLDVAHRSAHLPELLTGLDRREVPIPVDHPSASAPQAWAAASPLLAIRCLLGLDVDLIEGHVRVDPLDDVGGGGLGLTGLQIGGRSVSVRTEDGSVQVTGLPPGVKVVRSPVR